MSKGEKKTILRTKNQERELWIEALRIIACFSVVLLHVSAIGVQNLDIYSREWTIYVMFNSISRIGVCCFVMISGALFLGKSSGENIGEIYKKYIFRIAILILVWSVMFFVFRLLKGDFDIISLKTIIIELINGYYHLWYLWMIIGLYAITPILNKIIEDEIICKYFLYLSIVVCWIPGMLAVVPQVEKIANIVLQEKMFLFLPLGYTGYYILGYYLYNNKIKHRNLLIFTGIIGMIYAVLGGIFYGRYIGVASQATFNNLTLNIVCYSAMVFIVVKERIGKMQFKRKTKNIIYKLADATLGIYLVHVVFVQISDYIMKTINYRYPLLSILNAFLIFIFGYFITSIIKQIPCVGKWVV